MVVLKKLSFHKISRSIRKRKVFHIQKNLKYRVKSSTLMETLVATVLIVVVFMMASMILNNLFSNTIETNTGEIDAHINELQYLYSNEKLRLPYHGEYNHWQVSITRVVSGNENLALFEAESPKTNQKILKEIIEVHNKY